MDRQYTISDLEAAIRTGHLPATIVARALLTIIEGQDRINQQQQLLFKEIRKLGTDIHGSLTEIDTEVDGLSTDVSALSDRVKAGTVSPDELAALNTHLDALKAARAAVQALGAPPAGD